MKRCRLTFVSQQNLKVYIDDDKFENDSDDSISEEDYAFDKESDSDLDEDDETDFQPMITFDTSNDFKSRDRVTMWKKCLVNPERGQPTAWRFREYHTMRASRTSGSGCQLPTRHLHSKGRERL